MPSSQNQNPENFDNPSNKKEKSGQNKNNFIPLKNAIAHPLFVSVSEAAKLGGITPKTIRRAIQAKKLNYRIFKNRYLIDLKSLVLYLFSNKKLKNKLKKYGLGQYIKKWEE